MSLWILQWAWVKQDSSTAVFSEPQAASTAVYSEAPAALSTAQLSAIGASESFSASSLQHNRSAARYAEPGEDDGSSGASSCETSKSGNSSGDISSEVQQSQPSQSPPVESSMKMPETDLIVRPKLNQQRPDLKKSIGLGPPSLQRISRKPSSTVMSPAKLKLQSPEAPRSDALVSDSSRSSSGNLQQRVDKGNDLVLSNASDVWCMIQPDGTFRMLWDFFLVFPLLVYLAIMTPFFLGFAWDVDRRFHIDLLYFESLIDFVFILDIFLNFRTGFVTQSGDVEYRSYHVAINYLRSWFIIDFSSGIPFSLFALLDSSNSSGETGSWIGSLKILKMSRTLRALRLFRFLKVSKILKSLKLLKLMINAQTREFIEDIHHQYADNVWVKFFQVMLLLTLICHLMACIWVHVGRQGSKRGDPNWFEQVYDSLDYKETKHGDRVGSVYLSAFYFCMTTMTSVGYGDITGQTDSERMFAILLEGVGCVTYALIVATLTSVIMSKDANSRKTSEQLADISSYVTHRQFPPSLGRKLRLYFRHYYTKKMAIDESQILTYLSAGLREEVTDYVMSTLMEEVALFRLLPASYWPHVLPLLRPCRFSAGEVLCTQGGDATEMYVILGGECTETSLHGSLSPNTNSSEELEPPSDSKNTNRNHSRTSHSRSKQVVSTRPIGVGDVVNPLAALGVWPKAVGTVISNEVTEAYAVVAKGFQALFTGDEARLKQIQGRVVFVEYVAMADTRAPTCWGVPVLHRPPDDALHRAFLFEQEHRATKQAECEERSAHVAAHRPVQEAPPPAIPRTESSAPTRRFESESEEKASWSS